jgi:uncharacterized damage-inducible protein DinB
MMTRHGNALFSRETLSELFRHMEWADGEVWRSVLVCGPACDDPTIRGLLFHLHVVQRAFLDVWKARDVRFPDPSEFRTIGDLHAWTATYYAEARKFLAAVNDDALSRRVVMPWAQELAHQMGRMPDAPTLAETMFQITSHSTYHRGQVNTRLRAVGGEPPLVDYIAWIWFGRPAAAPPY